MRHAPVLRHFLFRVKSTMLCDMIAIRGALENAQPGYYPCCFDLARVFFVEH